MTAARPTRRRPCLTILIPAAGGSARMRGRDKLLEHVRGRPLLADRVSVATSAIAASADRATSSAGTSSAHPAPGAGVIVALPPRAVAADRWAALSQTEARLIEVADHRAGLSASLRAGIAALPRECAGLMILPADMPDITAGDIAVLLDAFDGAAILRGASADGRPGHPVLFPARDFRALAAVTGDRGGRAVIEAARARTRLVSLPGEHALTDLDTPEDWAAWRARQP